MRSLMKRITEKFGNLYRQKMIIHHHQDVFATQEEITKIQLIVPVAFGLKEMKFNNEMRFSNEKNH